MPPTKMQQTINTQLPPARTSPRREHQIQQNPHNSSIRTDPQHAHTQTCPIVNGAKTPSPKKNATQRVRFPAPKQSSHNSNARAFCEAQHRMAQQREPSVYFHYNVEAKVEPNGNQPRLEVTPYTPTLTPNVDLPIQPPQRIDAEMERGNAKLKRNLTPMRLSQIEQKGLSVELPSSLTPSIASDIDGNDDEKADHDENIIGDVNIQESEEVDAMDHKLHLKLTEQRHKLKKMSHRVHSMQSVPRIAEHIEDDDVKEDGNSMPMAPMADYLQYMLPNGATPTAAPVMTRTGQPLHPLSLNPQTPRCRVSLPSPLNPATMANQLPTPKGYATDHTPRILNLPSLSFSCSPSFSQTISPTAQSFSFSNMNVPSTVTPHAVVSLPPTSAKPVTQPMTSAANLSRLDPARKAQFIAAQNKVAPIQALPMTVAATAAAPMASTPIADPTAFPVPSLSMPFDTSLSCFSMSPDLPPIPDPSQYLSYLQ